jgi:hypothetical protein
MQTDWLPQSEDCLTINVRRPAASSDKPLLVMVWIYGGALVHGNTLMYPGDALAAQGVVLVSMNDRIGRLGFFAFPALAEESPKDPGQLWLHGPARCTQMGSAQHRGRLAAISRSWLFSASPLAAARSWLIWSRRSCVNFLPLRSCNRRQASLRCAPMRSPSLRSPGGGRLCAIDWHQG